MLLAVHDTQPSLSLTQSQSQSQPQPTVSMTPSQSQPQPTLSMTPSQPQPQPTVSMTECESSVLGDTGLVQSIELRQVERHTTVMHYDSLYIHLRIAHALPSTTPDDSERDQRKFKLDPQEELLYLGCERRLRKDGGNERHYFQRVKVIKKYKNKEFKILPDCKDGCNCYRRRADIPAGQFTIDGWSWVGPFRVVGHGRVRREAQPSGKATKPCDTDVYCLSLNGHYTWAEAAFLSLDSKKPLAEIGGDLLKERENEESPASYFSNEGSEMSTDESSVQLRSASKRKRTIKREEKAKRNTTTYEDDDTETDQEFTPPKRHNSHASSITTSTQPIQTNVKSTLTHAGQVLTLSFPTNSNSEFFQPPTNADEDFEELNGRSSSTEATEATETTSPKSIPFSESGNISPLSSPLVVSPFFSAEIDQEIDDFNLDFHAIDLSEGNTTYYIKPNNFVVSPSSEDDCEDICDIDCSGESQSSTPIPTPTTTTPSTSTSTSASALPSSSSILCTSSSAIATLFSTASSTFIPIFESEELDTQGWMTTISKNPLRA